MRLKADLTLLLVSMIWGSAFVAQRIAGQLGSVFLFNGARYLLAGLVVSLFLGRNLFNSFNQIPREQFKWMTIAGFLLFLGSASQQAGMVYTSAGNAGFISGLYVVLVPFALFGGWGEKPHWLSIVAVLLASLGAFLLSTGGRFEARFGDLLELFGAIFWTFHVIVLGKFASKYGATSFSIGQLFICAILNLSFGYFTESAIIFNWPIALGIVYTACFALGMCYTLQIWAQRHTPPADAALILSLESVFAVVSGWLILNERLYSIQVWGCVLILLAVVLSQFKVWNSGRAQPDQLVEGR